MTAVPYIPDNAPFSPEQRAWLNGFFAGMFSRGPGGGTQTTAVAATPALTPLTILFGSQTGTAESLAKKAAKEAGKRNFAATVLDMAQTDLVKLAGEKNVLVITSTYGDGEPPDNAKALHAALAAGGVSLAGVRFSVCGLGDTNYTQFCQCAKDFDARLEKAGATRVSARVECDLDYEAKFNAWLGEALGAFALGGESGVGGAELRVSGSESEAKAETASGFSRQRPYSALLSTSRTLNGAGSAKQVNHVEFDLGDSGLVYEAGDALGVYAHNCPELVNELLAVLGCDGEEAVPAPDGSSIPLRRALTEFYDLGKPSDELRERFGGVVAHHVVDALAGGVGVKIAPAEFVKTLKKLQPRLYSISSSPKAHPGQVHLTVGAVRYEKDGRPRKGVCSTFLADRAQAGVTRVGVFVHSNKAFRPPANPDAPMIMVGPGTGIAPFRAFLEERRATGAKGKMVVLRRSAGGDGFPVSGRVGCDAARRCVDAAGYGVFARSGGEDLCAAANAGERAGAVRVARGRRALLRVRRCEPDGEGRGRGAASGDRTRRRKIEGAGGGVCGEVEGGEAVCARRVLSRK